MRIKVLVISHNCFNTFQNMGKTLMALFNEFSKNELCQLYLYPSYPNIDNCNSQYRITDIDVLSSIFGSNKCGKIINKSYIKENNTLYDDSKHNNIYKSKKKKKNYLILARELVWKIGKWKTPDLMEWIEKEKPNVIFYASGDSCFSYNIAIYLSKKYNIPLVTYFCDDHYTFNKFSLSPLYWLHKLLLRKCIKKIVNSSKELIYISEEFENYFFSLFNKHGKTIMTPYSKAFPNYYNMVRNKPIIISYIGNLDLNRWQTLIDIGVALDKINEKEIHAVLNIYSHVTDIEIIRKLTSTKSIFFKGAISTEQVYKTMEESDFLLHVESFKKADAIRVRFSVSTKISDILASNKPLIAIGPGNIASIKYLKENNAAFIIDNQNAINEKLSEYLTNIDYNIIKNAKELAEKNHNIRKNSGKLKQIFECLF